MFGGPSPEAEHLAITADQLDLLVGVHPTEGVRASAQQPNTGVAGQVSRVDQVDLALGEERVDLFGRDVELRHAGPAGRDHVLGVVLVGGQAHRAGLDAQRNVLGDQRDSLALGGQIGRAGQDPSVVGVGAEAQRQHRRVGVVQFNLKRSTLCPNRNGLIETTVLDSKVVEQPQRLPGEPAQLMVVALGFQFADHHERYHHFVFGEPVARPRIGQQDRGVEHVSPTVGRQRLGHGALL